MSQEVWMSASEFGDAGNASEWDALMSRGSGVPAVNRWERDSLYQRFDPLVSRRTSVIGPRGGGAGPSHSHGSRGDLPFQGTKLEGMGALEEAEECSESIHKIEEESESPELHEASPEIPIILESPTKMKEKYENAAEINGTHDSPSKMKEAQEHAAEMNGTDESPSKIIETHYYAAEMNGTHQSPSTVNGKHEHASEPVVDKVETEELEGKTEVLNLTFEIEHDMSADAELHAVFASDDLVSPSKITETQEHIFVHVDAEVQGGSALDETQILESPSKVTETPEEHVVDPLDDILAQMQKLEISTKSEEEEVKPDSSLYAQVPGPTETLILESPAKTIQTKDLNADTEEDKLEEIQILETESVELVNHPITVESEQDPPGEDELKIAANATQIVILGSPSKNTETLEGKTDLVENKLAEMKIMEIQPEEIEESAIVVKVDRDSGFGASYEAQILESLSEDTKMPKQKPESVEFSKSEKCKKTSNLNQNSSDDAAPTPISEPPTKITERREQKPNPNLVDAGLVELQKLERQLVELEESTKTVETERQKAVNDLNAVEESFAKTLMSYESGKVYQKNFENNQKVLKRREVMLKKGIARREEKLSYVQKKVDDVIERFKRDQDAKLKELEVENMKLRAKMKMAEMKLRKLESEISQTTVETEKLRALCDEMTIVD